MKKRFGKHVVKSSPLSGMAMVFNEEANIWMYRPDVIVTLMKNEDSELRQAYEYCEKING